VLHSRKTKFRDLASPVAAGPTRPDSAPDPVHPFPIPQGHARQNISVKHDPFAKVCVTCD
jgi:hypothetical protein